MTKKIVMVNFSHDDYGSVSDLVTSDGIKCISIDGDSEIIFRDAFTQANAYNEKDDKYILFSDFDNEEITALYNGVRKLFDHDFILVKLMENNAEMQLRELLAEVSREDLLMKRYYYLEKLFKAINIMEPALFDEADRKKIMYAYSIYKNETFELDGINEAVGMMEELIRSKDA